MVNVYRRRCLNDFFLKKPSFNVARTMTVAYCEQHADDGMVNVYGNRCSSGSLMKAPAFNAEGS